MGSLTINITPDIYQEAEQRNLSYKKKYGNTGTHRLNKDRQRMTGYLAEASIRSYFPQLNYSDNDNIDLYLLDYQTTYQAFPQVSLLTLLYRMQDSSLTSYITILLYYYITLTITIFQSINLNLFTNILKGS